MKDNLQKKLWETQSVEEALINIGSSTEGLSNDEAAQRLLTFGKNSLPEAKRDGFIKRFLAQFHN
ncbi:MAG: cation-transporting P-type ATPase, partial [Elusimicrobia bacterium]|nr:cation-transporting P-type ATPase [Elusimicrobiota bacterium]